MPKLETLELEPEVTQKVRVKTTERECPRCEALLDHNNKEECYECLNCGYIDCGDFDY